jgi:DNA-directed RNA polymerase I, II, and III subunit RPABC1
MTTNRAARVRQTLLEMFDQRGYMDIDASEENRILAFEKDTKEQVCAFSVIIQKLNVAEIKTYITAMQAAGINHFILVYEGNTTSAVNSVVNNAPKLKMNIELLEADYLQINITKHKLVPQHILLDRKEAFNFKKKYGMKIPVLLRTDPVSRFYNFQKGSIVKIVRRDGDIAYRTVK